MNTQHEVRRHLLRRRDFLVLGAAGALAPWLGGVAHAAETARAVGVTTAEPMSVGYVNGSGELPRLSRASWALSTDMAAAGEQPLEVLPAAGLDLGDQELAGGDVKLRVQGLYPSTPAGCRGVEEVDLDVFFPSPDPAFPKPLRFMAWSFRRRPGIDISPPLSFRVPLALDGGLTLALRVAYRGEGRDLAQRVLQGSPVIERLYRTSFTVDWQAGRPKLQRGTYLLGVRPAIWDASTALPRATAGSRAADFCSVVLSVEPIAPE
jgi:hypothetical protein